MVTKPFAECDQQNISFNLAKIHMVAKPQTDFIT